MGLFAITLLTLGLTGEISAKTYTAEKGGYGGGHYEVVCNSNDYLVGFGYNAGKALDNVTPLCRSVKNEKWSGNTYKRKLVGGATTGGPFMATGTVVCEKDQFVTSLHVWWDGYGIVHHLQVNCHSFDRKKEFSGQTGNHGGAPEHNAGTSCLNGQFAIGIAGRSGALVDKIGLVCELAPK
jgi:hypothetical protein